MFLGSRRTGFIPGRANHLYFITYKEIFDLFVYDKVAFKCDDKVQFNVFSIIQQDVGFNRLVLFKKEKKIKRLLL